MYGFTISYIWEHGYLKILVMILDRLHPRDIEKGHLGMY